MGEEVNHKGRIETIEGNHIVVRILQTSACLHCKIAGHCNSAESKEKLVDVWTQHAEKYIVGQDVEVVMRGRVGLKAVFLAFVLPVIIAFAAIWAELQMTSPSGVWPLSEPYNEGVGALVGVVVFIVYYTLLYFFRDSLQKQFRFRIKE